LRHGGRTVSFLGVAICCILFHADRPTRHCWPLLCTAQESRATGDRAARSRHVDSAGTSHGSPEPSVVHQHLLVLRGRENARGKQSRIEPDRWQRRTRCVSGGVGLSSATNATVANGDCVFDFRPTLLHRHPAAYAAGSPLPQATIQWLGNLHASAASGEYAHKKIRPPVQRPDTRLTFGSRPSLAVSLAALSTPPSEWLRPKVEEIDFRDLGTADGSCRRKKIPSMAHRRCKPNGSFFRDDRHIRYRFFLGKRGANVCSKIRNELPS
jgi:hypothetical protein